MTDPRYAGDETGRPLSAGEDPEERVARELDELLQQLRITLPGVQVLFAFLLTVPFTNRFQSVQGTQRTVFFVAFLATAGASALLLAPVAYARIQFRQFDKERLIRLHRRGTWWLGASCGRALRVHVRGD